MRGVARGSFTPAPCFGSLALDAILLGRENLLSDAALVEELQELLLLALKLLQPPSMALGLLTRRRHQGLGVIAHCLAYGFALNVSKAHAAVVALDCVLDIGDLNVPGTA
ncbi:MAG TPA: hypothetical protein VG188_10270 [Solirubrobacteraceae bacterium]|nr:hypothetical protein [Solirubrobacteraceae bacterium]